MPPSSRLSADSSLFSGEDAPLPVGEFVLSAKRTIEQSLEAVWVSGEVANFTRAASGHWYFVLRDARAQVSCAMMAGENRRTGLDRLNNGDKLVVLGKPTMYAPRGHFQLAVRSLRLDGVGRLYELFLRRKKEWHQKGWFDSNAPLPAIPECVGVVCSLAGAALHDVLRTIRTHFPAVTVVLYPAPAQGVDAAEKIGRAIATADERRECDVLLVCRGGGGIEDLWAYNEEPVVAAIYRCGLPVVTGIGHEVDETLADYAADLRCPTPTAAAMAAIGAGADLRQRLADGEAALRRGFVDFLDERLQRVDWAARVLASPSVYLAKHGEVVSRCQTRLLFAANHLWNQWFQRHTRLAAGLRQPNWIPYERNLRERARGLRTAVATELQRLSTRLEAGGRALELLSPEHLMKRGYSIVRRPEGGVVTEAEGLQAGDPLRITFYRGEASVVVEKKGD